MDTVFAQATAPGRAGVSVIRISGPGAADALISLAGSLPDPREATLRAVSRRDGQLIDRGLVLWFPAPNSFTGEDVAELQLHGSVAVVNAVMEELTTFPGTRLAEPGEFTRRALENNRMDLTEVEGLAELIDAETEAQRKQAMAVFSGKLGARVEGWRRGLIRAAALLEATIDFADEEVPVDVSPEVHELLSSVLAELRADIAGSHVAERVRAGFQVAILGAPNVGKSTLLNALAGRDAAITSATAGTTRDIIEVQMDLSGIPVTLLDTAGLRETDDEIEAEGVSRALERAERADVRVFLMSGQDDLMMTPEPDDIVLQAKIDLREDTSAGISGKTGQGVSQLISALTEALSKRTAQVGVATHARHRLAMQSASEGIERAMTVLAQGPDQYDIAAAELRFGIQALDVLVGRIDVENLLDEIFLSFCVGK